MHSRLIVLLSSIGAVLCVTEDIFIETPEGSQLLNGFAVYDQFLFYQERFVGGRMKAAASFVAQHSKVPFAQLFSNMATSDYILIQILHALYSEDTSLLTYLAELATTVDKTEPKREENDWIRRNIKFPSEKSFQVMKSLVILDRNGIMKKLPLILLKEIILIVDMASALETATEVGNMDVIKGILKFDINFNNLDTLFKSAFSNNKIDVVKVLIEKGALDKLPINKTLIDLTSSKEETLLHLAAQSHRPAAVAALLEEGLEPNEMDDDGFTALHRAVEADDEEAAALLVKGGARVDQGTPQGDLPLHLAVSKGNLRMTKLLIQLGSPLDTKNNLGFTPLYVAENTVVAAVLRYIEDIRWEQRMNESKNCREHNCDTERSTSALNTIFLEDINNFFTNLNMRDIFCHNNNIPFIVTLSEIVNLLLRKGEVSRMSSHLQFLLSLKANKIGKEELSEIMINLGYDSPDININPILDSIEDLNAAFMSFDENVKFKNQTGHTNLHVSASEGDLKAVKALVSKGADVEARTNDSWTPLHFAASQGHENIVRYLIQKNASMNAKTSNQETPLHLASANDHADVVKALLENNADVNAEMHPDCMTSLYIASRAGHLEVVKVLVEGDASLKQRDCGNYNLTPFQIALLNGRISVVRFLSLHGANIDERDTVGNTPLYTAAWNGMDTMVKTLIELGANLKSRVGQLGLTAVHAAAARGHAQVVELLLREGADPDIKDRNHATPLHWASSLEVAKVLLNNGAYVDTRNINRETPLHKASSLGRADVVRELLQRGADIDAKTIDGKTPAYEAILQNQYYTLKILIENGTNINAKGPNGLTVLNFGISKGMLKYQSG
ncbi:unnamed protein product [Nezara viridula]|uniref:Uncharacterized protein n=1 Tax=Nezara viridula TaxID=85310 RepID=A0A9P0H8S9_NEZVI|nr:unnamed protein product [Nezara viridula]